MRKFVDYIKNRSSMPIIEMAHDPKILKGKKTYEILRTPIFLDHEDIKFLRFFPPKFWGQAYAQLMNKVLVDEEKSIQAGQAPKTHYDFTFGINQDGSGKQIVFKNIPVGEEVFKGGLHHKMSGTVDHHTYKSLRNHPNPLGPEAEGHYSSTSKDLNKEGKKGGRYGFPTAQTEGGFTAGLGELNPETVHARIKDIQHGIKQGWLANDVHKHQEHGEGINIKSYDPDASLEKISHEVEGEKKPKEQVSVKDPQKLLSKDKPVILGERKDTVDKSYALSAKKLMTSVFHDQIEANRQLPPDQKNISLKYTQGEGGKPRFASAEFNPQANVGAIRKIDNTGTVTWSGVWADTGKEARFRSKIPVMFPAQRINSAEFRKGNLLRRSSWVLDDVLQNDQLMDSFLTLLRTPEEQRNQMQRDLEGKESIKDTHSSEEKWMKLKMLRVLNDNNHVNIYTRLAEKLIPQKPSDQAPPTKEQLVSQLHSIGNPFVKNALRLVRDDIKQHAIKTQQTTDRHSIHGFQVKNYNKIGSNPVGDNYTGFGTVEPNRNTGEIKTSGLEDWASKDRGELEKYLGFHGYTDTSGSRISAGFDSSRMPHVLKYKKFGDEAQADKIADKKREDRLDALRNILVSGEHKKDGKIVPITKKERKAYEEERDVLEKEKIHSDREMWGPIGRGINSAIDQLGGTAKGPALKAIWNDLFHYAVDEVRRKAGDQEFLDWEDIKDSSTATPNEKREVWNNLYKTVSNIAKNYVARIWQLNLDNQGTRRVPVSVTSLNKAVGENGKEMADLLDQEVTKREVQKTYDAAAAEAKRSGIEDGEVFWARSLPGLRALAAQVSQETKDSNKNDNEEMKNLQDKMLDAAVKYQIAKAAYLMHKPNANDDETEAFAEKFMRGEDVQSLIQVDTGRMAASTGVSTSNKPFDPVEWLKGANPAKIKSSPTIIAQINSIYSMPETPEHIKELIRDKYKNANVPVPGQSHTMQPKAPMPATTTEPTEPLYTAKQAAPVPTSHGLGKFIKKPVVQNPPVQEWLVELKKKYNQ